MAVPVVTTTLTTAMAKVLKSRTRSIIAANAVFSADDATVTVTPAPPLTATTGTPPYATATVTVTLLDVAGSYRCRPDIPGVTGSWSNAVTTTGAGPYTATFTGIQIGIGTGITIAVSPALLLGSVIWRSAAFNVVAAVTLTVVAGADPLDITLRMTNNDGANTTQATVDWGDATAATTDTIANWVTGKAHSYAAPGTYTITATPKDGANAVRGTITTSAPLAGVRITATMDGSVARRAHAAVTPSTRVSYVSSYIQWGDSLVTGTPGNTGPLPDIPHDYAAPASYRIVFNTSTGLTNAVTLAVP